LKAWYQAWQLKCSYESVFRWNPFLRTLFVLAVSLLPTASAQFIQQGSKLVAKGSFGTSMQEQGSSVALSADGNTAIVGGFQTYPTGAAWIYTRSGGLWNQQGDRLSGTDTVGTSYQD
jgi:hypothetical protein